MNKLGLELELEKLRDFQSYKRLQETTYTQRPLVRYVDDMAKTSRYDSGSDFMLQYISWVNHNNSRQR